MKFNIERDLLEKAISTVQKGVTGKSPMPILQGIYISAENDKVTLRGSDLDISVETSFEAEIEEEGSIVLDSKLFGEIIKKYPSKPVKLSTEDNSVNIKCSRSKSTLVSMDAEEFPKFPELNKDKEFSLKQNVLKDMIKGTLFSIAQDETRPILTGVLFELKDGKLTLVSLDGYRLSSKYTEVNSGENFEIVVPGKTLSEVNKILKDTEEDVNISMNSNHILFEINGTKITSRLLEGQFIPYKSIIPKESSITITAKRVELLECIERASLMSRDGTTSLIKFNIDKDNLQITSNSKLGTSVEELNIVTEGPKLEIAFNSKYLIELLKVLSVEEVKFELTGSVNPCVLRNENGCYLVLPIRLLSANAA